MLKKIALIIVLSLVFSFSLTIESKAESKEVVRSYTEYFTTLVKFTFRDVDTVSDHHWDLIEAELERIQNTFSRTDSNSELYQLNQSAGVEPFEASDDLYFVIKKAVEYAELTDGKFEPTIGPLIDLWGPINQDVIPPTKEEISRIKPLIDYKLIEFNDENKTIYLPKKGMQIDLGAISKGYAADKIGALIKELGYEHVIINLGGNVLTIGTRDTKNPYGTDDWWLGLTNPKYNQDLRETDKYSHVLVTNKTIVSSGTYERAWYAGDKKYHHILDPNTGYSVDNDIEMVTIITESSTTADALSTSILGLGIKKGMEVIESLDGVDAIFVTYERDVFISSGIIPDSNFYIVNKHFKLKAITDYVEPDFETYVPIYEPIPAPENNTLRNISIAGVLVILLSGLGLLLKKISKKTL